MSIRIECARHHTHSILAHAHNTHTDKRTDRRERKASALVDVNDARRSISLRLCAAANLLQRANAASTPKRTDDSRGRALARTTNLLIWARAGERNQARRKENMRARMQTAPMDCSIELKTFIIIFFYSLNRYGAHRGSSSGHPG